MVENFQRKTKLLQNVHDLNFFPSDRDVILQQNEPLLVLSVFATRKMWISCSLAFTWRIINRCRLIWENLNMFECRLTRVNVRNMTSNERVKIWEFFNLFWFFQWRRRILIWIYCSFVNFWWVFYLFYYLLINNCKLS